MLDLDFEIAEIRKKLDLSSSDLAQVVSSLNKEVAAHVQAAITEGASKIQKAITSNLERDHALRIRLSGLEVAASASSRHHRPSPWPCRVATFHASSLLRTPAPESRPRI